MFTPYTGEVSKMTDMLNLIDFVLNVVFTIELCAKLVALGWKVFIQSWNKLDLFIVTT
jgi:TRAP-type mannitol/chloroaromatic compound transport system permease small subunit